MNRLIAFANTLVATSCSFLISTHIAALELIRYPQPMQTYDKHHIYPLSLLKLAISKVEPNYQLAPSDVFMNQGRALKQLEAGNDIEILWTMTSEAREQTLNAIRIPIYKGLIGWRVFLINADTKIDLTRPISLEQVKKLKTVQGHDWPDTVILQHNQFNVQTGPHYEGLFKMLQYQRIDLLPRSIIEVWDELKINAASNIKLEQHTLISYPTASYYFVSKDNQALAQVVRRGLEIALKDGSFDALFQLHFSKMIKQAKLDTRIHYRLENPLLTEETPLENKRLWFLPN